MTKIFRKLKNKEGFTLVELIVVIAILAILAAVAIPAYSGYIAKANEASDYTLLDSVLTATQFAVIEEYPAATIDKIEISAPQPASGATAVNVSVDYTLNGTAKTGETFDIAAFVPSVAFKSGNSKATWTKATATDNEKWTLSK